MKSTHTLVAQLLFPFGLLTKIFSFFRSRSLYSARRSSLGLSPEAKYIAHMPRHIDPVHPSMRSMLSKLIARFSVLMVLVGLGPAFGTMSSPDPIISSIRRFPN